MRQISLDSSWWEVGFVHTEFTAFLTLSVPCAGPTPLRAKCMLDSKKKLHNSELLARDSIPTSTALSTLLNDPQGWTFLLSLFHCAVFANWCMWLRSVAFFFWSATSPKAEESQSSPEEGSSRFCKLLRALSDFFTKASFSRYLTQPSLHNSLFPNT